MKETVGVGIIGTGFARKVQIPAFKAADGAGIVSIASGRLENAEAAAKELGAGHFTADWRETASHPDVDLVCITTPPRLHREMTLFAIDHGKHVLAEKPMAMNTAEAEEMASAAGKVDKLTLIDHELRFLPGRQKAYAMMRDGAIGKVRHAKYSFRAPHRGDPALLWNWWSDADEGGGALGAINSHIVDSFNWFLGTGISSVFCQLQTHIQRRPFGDTLREVTTDDEANMLLRFADGELTDDATGLVSVSMVEQPEYLNRIEFFGTEGALRIDHRGDVYIGKNGETEWTAVDVDFAPGVQGVPESGFPSGFMAFAAAIVEAIKAASTYIEHAATFEDGVRVQRILDAARASNKSGRVVLLP
jgi:predicted dehydrogenase